ncbi:toll/interleukin-1 receptor domain-containing protein [Bacteroides bouchesdurhonensis]|uniref:toll/interleukin-1 receptor domain-containing protein n=1 Tax=Bacteroides bouchesdurhonensis TaxID=1841855 RepID=UPI0016521346|nr:toll/interleukin-1 receptor domain-containing protein [Bacteroides bouchesdurhonensis]
MESLTHDVFISYSSCDQKIAEGLSAYLEQNGIRCFVAYRDIPRGVVWAAAITKAIEDCKMMVVIFSDNFNKSVQVGREIELCANENKPILTFKITNHDFEGTAKYYLNSINWIDAFPNPQKSFGEVLISIKKLINTSCEDEVIEKKQAVSPKNKCKLLRNKIFVVSIFIFCILIICTGRFYYNKLQRDKEYQTLLKQAEEYDEKSDWSMALELYNKALELNSEDAKLYYQIGLVYAQKQDNNKAIECFINAIKADSTVDAFYYSLGVTYSELEMHDKAIECFKKRVEITPSPDVYFMMSYEYKALSQYTEALECMKIAVSKDPKNATYYYAIAKIYGEIGDKENEKSSYGKSALYGDEDAQDWLNSHK